MKKDVEVAVIFLRKYVKERNITILIPQKVITGNCIQDSKFFVDNIEKKAFKNMDEVNYQKQEYGFYYATSLKKLEEMYETKDLEFILQKYLDEICTKVHYYVSFDEDNFDSYLLKSLNIDDFNKRYSVNLKYNLDSNETKKKDINKNNSNISCDDLVGQDIVKIRRNLKNEILFQERAIDKIIKSIYTNYILGNQKNNIIISGPAGVGKTEALKTIVNCSNHPSVYCSLKDEYADENNDADYILNNILLRLREDVIKNNKMDDHSIIVLDDFDKLDEYQKYDFQEELIRFLKSGLRGIKTNSKIIFDASKITFILCGNFEDVKKVINVPKKFFKNVNFKIDENDLGLNTQELIENYYFLDELLHYFQTDILFDELNIKKAMEIIKSLHNKTMLLYFNQLKKQGIKEIELTDNFIEEFANYVYSEQLNLKDLDAAVIDVFSDVMMESLEYLGMSTNLTINNEILQKDKKGYQFTLKK